MDHDLSIGKDESLTLGAARQKRHGHGSRHAQADRRDIAFHELHGVVNGKAGGNASSGRIDVE